MILQEFEGTQVALSLSCFKKLHHAVKYLYISNNFGRGLDLDSVFCLFTYNFSSTRRIYMIYSIYLAMS